MANVIALRHALVEHLKGEGSIRTASVENAFCAVPRHIFVPQASLEDAYADRVVRIKESEGTLLSSCSQPAIIAEMLEQLAVAQGDRVLEIGTGSGYTAALLASLTGDAGHVTSIDIEPDLVTQAREHLRTAGFAAVKILARDGTIGDPDAAPFDRILLTVSSSDITNAWWQQLAPNGRLVMPLSLKGIQKSIAFAHEGALLKSETMIDCGFIMLRGSDEGLETIHALSRDPPVFLGADSALPLDTAALAKHLLHERPVETAVPMDVYPRELFGSLAIWLGFKEPGCCKVETHGRGAMLPTITPRSLDYRFSIGLCANDTVALVHFDKKLRIFRFGPDLKLATRLRDRLLEWNKLGRPGSADLQIVAMRNDERDMRMLAHANETIERRHTTFCLIWASEAPTDSFAVG